MAWPSGELYGGRLRAHASVARHTLAGLVPPAPGAAADPHHPASGAVLLLIDTTGCDMEESAGGGGGDADSKCNEGEARVRRKPVAPTRGRPAADLTLLWLAGAAHE